MSRFIVHPIFFLKHNINCISRSFRTTFKTMTISIGDRLPEVDLYEDTPANKINLAKASIGKKLIIFGVPGAFTPGCSKTHLPGYIKKAEEFKSNGYNEIFCVAVNDPFVMSAWGKQTNVDGKVRMLADPACKFTDALELSVNLDVLGGKRSKRYSMVVEDGKVIDLNVEPDNTGLSCSLADNIK
ncbi:PREDICTED: peroxiredoxin-5, mitochondrial [Ceratosolen solmsi marchali]|uniref:Peroxiredoxin-5 n=1 Tax=Ceratosolen solmsi marchali TaxID=326594 RepID=A0AAJ7DXD5_9HYME|nr:PREDICTED: peroxiredoxin-5, mitochondrial [Ceratosolen solmsi marchali]